jgi:hypothetical protein
MASIIAPKPLGSYRLLANHRRGITQIGESTKKARSCHGLRIQRPVDALDFAAALLFMTRDESEEYYRVFAVG